MSVVYVGRYIRDSVDAEDHESIAQSSSMSRLLNLMHGLLTHACTTTLSFSTIRKMHQIDSDAAVFCRRLPAPVRPEADAPDPSGACCACAVHPSPTYRCKLLVVVGLTLVNLRSLSFIDPPRLLPTPPRDLAMRRALPLPMYVLQATKFATVLPLIHDRLHTLGS